MMHLEMLEFKQFKPKIIFLHEQMTDLALANGNKEFFKFLFGFVRKKYGADLGLMTNNGHILIKKLHEWQIPIKIMHMPLNKYGYQMKPTQEEFESLLKKSNATIFAANIGTTTVPKKEELEYIAKLGINNIVFEIGASADAFILGKLFEKQQ